MASSAIDGSMESLLKHVFITYHQRRIDECKKHQDATQASTTKKHDVNLDSLLDEAFAEFKAQQQQLPAVAASDAARLAFEKRGVTLEVFQRMRDICKAQNVESSEIRCREAAAAGCVRYVVTYQGLIATSSREVKQGDFIDALPGSTTSGADDECPGWVFVQLLDGSCSFPLRDENGTQFLEQVGPVPEEAFVNRPGYWTIGRMSALVIGNHEILVTDEKDAKEAVAIAEGKTSDSVYRWGKHVDPSSTLTHAGQCSLIEMIRQGRFESHDAPLGGNLRYDQVVGAKADIFVSFAYSSDFIELVDALECFFERTPSLDKNSTYLWFDLFVNDQWTALDKPFEWWESTFKEAVEEIGHTVVVMLPWKAPIPLTRVWCLFEIACSTKKLSIALSSAQVKAFQHTLRHKGTGTIMKSLCKIDVEQATSYLPEDKEKIFAVIRASKDSFHGINVSVSSKVRDWVAASASELVLDQEARGGEGEDEEDALWALGDLYRLGHVHFEQGRYEEAEKALTRALDGYESLLGPDHKDIFDVVNDLGNVCIELGKFEQAEQLYMRALAGREENFGPKHEKTLDTVNSLGCFYFKQGKLEQAEKFLMRALVGDEETLSSTHTSTLTTLSNLGNLYTVQGDLVKAEKFFMRALGGSEESPKHMCTLLAMMGLGSLYMEQGKLEQAEKFFMQALVGNEQTLGPTHIDTLKAVGNLGILYSNQGKLEQAEQFFMRALVGYEQTFGPTHIDTLKTVGNLGNLFMEQGKFEQAEQHLKRFLVGKEMTHGAKSTLDTVKNLGSICIELGKFEQAEQLYMRALAGYEEMPCPKHINTLSIVFDLGNLYYRQGKLEQAEQFFMRALVGFEENFGPNHANTLKAVGNLGILYSDQGKLEQAEQFLMRAFVGNEEKFGPTHASTLNTAALDATKNLGSIYIELGKLEKAEQLLMRALAGYEEILGPNHTSTVMTVYDLGIVYSDQGKLEQAEQFYKRALFGQEAKFGPKHIDTLKTVNNLGTLYAQQGKLEQAEQFWLRALVGKEEILGPTHASTLVTARNLAQIGPHLRRARSI